MAEKITVGPDGILQVPDEPIIPFIEGDGTGVDIWPAAQRVIDAAAAKRGRKIEWKEVLAGQKAFDATGDWLPEETILPELQAALVDIGTGVDAFLHASDVVGVEVSNAAGNTTAEEDPARRDRTRTRAPAHPPT